MMAQGARGKSEHFSLRMATPVLESLEQRAGQTGEPKSTVAERYIDEGLKQDAHPEIVFRDSPFGRRAMLAGTRLDIWQVIETLRNSGNSLEDAADYLALSLPKVRACLAYYAAYQDEVDRYASRIREANEQAEAAWRREQELIGA